jgi:hypothetical protein
MLYEEVANNRSWKYNTAFAAAHVWFDPDGGLLTAAAQMNMAAGREAIQ